MFFPPPILWDMWSSDHPQEDLAIFGNRSESKVETFRNLAIIWQHAVTYCLNLAIWKKFPHNLATLGHFFPPKTPLYESHWPFFCCQDAKFRPKNEKSWSGRWTYTNCTLLSTSRKRENTCAPPCDNNVKVRKPFVITWYATLSATLAIQEVHYHMRIVP